MGRQTTNHTSRPHSAGVLVSGLKHLLQNYIATSTASTYERALVVFKSFLVLYSFSTHLPTTPIVLALYVTYLYTQKYSHRTILTHLAATSYMHRCHQMAEPNKNFLVQRALLGIKRCVPVQDCRFPISLPLLYRLHESVNHLIYRPYARAMFQAMYMLAFYAFLKVSEFTLSHGQADNLLQFHQIMLDADRKAVQVAFHRYKHSNNMLFLFIPLLAQSVQSKP